MSLSDDPYVLVVGGQDDYQLTQARKYIERRAPVVFVDHEARNSFSCEISHTGALTLTLNGEEIAEPALFWSRLKLPIVLGDWTPETLPEFVRRAEWSGFISNLAYYFHGRAIQPLARVARLDRKAVQYRIAGEVGFRVPKTSFFLGKQTADATIRKWPSVVAKPFVARNVPGLKRIDKYTLLFTMPVTAGEIDEADEKEFATPHFFQERVTTGQEYRVIGFRDRVFFYRVRGRVEDRPESRPDERIMVG